MKNSCRIVIRWIIALIISHCQIRSLEVLTITKTPQTYNLERSRHFSMFRSGTFSRYSPGGAVGSCVLNNNHFFYDKTYDTSTSRPCQVRVKLILVFTSVISVPPFHLFYFFKFLLFVLSRTPSVPTERVVLNTKTITPATFKSYNYYFNICGKNSSILA